MGLLLVDRNGKNKGKVLFIVCLMGVIFFEGCVSLPTKVDEVVYDVPSIQDNIETIDSPVGIYHKVRRKETIWRIAKTYDVTIKDIIANNRRLNVEKVEVGQRIFIPGVDEIRKVFQEERKTQKEFIWPIKGRLIKRFHRSQVMGRENRGIDIQSSSGQTVKASRMGRVVFADYMPGHGYAVILDHLDGFHSIYTNNAELLVGVGDLVFKRTNISRIARIKKTAYLHFEIRKHSQGDNPLRYLP